MGKRVHQVVVTVGNVKERKSIGKEKLANAAVRAFHSSVNTGCICITVVDIDDSDLGVVGAVKTALEFATQCHALLAHSPGELKHHDEK